MYWWRWRHTVHSSLLPTQFFAYLYTHLPFPCPVFKQLFPFQAFTTLSLDNRSTYIEYALLDVLACRDQHGQTHLPPYFPSAQTITHWLLCHHFLSLLSVFMFGITYLTASPAPIPYPVLASPYWCSVCMGGTDRGLLHWTGWAFFFFLLLLNMSCLYIKSQSRYMKKIACNYFLLTGYSEPPYFGLLRGRSLVLNTACQLFCLNCVMVVKTISFFFFSLLLWILWLLSECILKRALWRRSQNSTSLAPKAPQILSDGQSPL